MSFSLVLYFILLGIWALLFTLIVIFGEIKKHKKETSEEEENKIASELHKIIKCALEDKNLTIAKRSFEEHKNYSEAQESHLSDGDIAYIITNNLIYDLDQDSIEMITNSLLMGVQYEYLIEMTHVNIKNVRKFRNGIKIAMEKQDGHNRKDCLKKLTFYMHKRGLYPYSFIIIFRANRTEADHSSFYFIKRENEINYIYEVQLDDNTEAMEQLTTAYNQLKEKSIYFDSWD